MSRKAEVLKKVSDIYAGNAFMHVCDISIHDIGCGWAKVGIKVKDGLHTNLNASLHGGMFMTLMDNATKGKRVVTVTTSTSFIKGANIGDEVEAYGEVIGLTGNKVNMVMHLRNLTTGDLMATSTSCMIVIDDFEGIPEKWE
ncbi:MAG: PaaI family thioesterase [Acidaminococcaceae bacterium]|nr:PaaI family thioesterase [Acidaminococcaceae bacterium]